MITLLKNRSLIKVSGLDSKSFLQSQFSNNVNNIKKNQVQFNAYCQHQGKIIALIWLILEEDYYFLSFPKDLKESVMGKLNMFKLMSKVDIEDLTSDFYQYGLIDEKNTKSYAIKDNLSLMISKEVLEVSNINFWEESCVNNLIPEVDLNSSEKYIPQVLNLDIGELGVSFSKGCYPGQEVIARMHYLGKSKRRLFIFNSQFEVKVGDHLNTINSDSLKPSGEIIRVAKVDNCFCFLATFEIKHISDQIVLNNQLDKNVHIVHEE